MIDLNERLSQNFTLREAVRSQTAARLGIDNTPDADVIERLRATACQVLQPVRDHFGVPFSPSSWFRCLELNRAIGSKDTSQHVTGQAVDFEVPGVANPDLARWIDENCWHDQLILEFFDEADPASGWIHVSFASRRNRGEVLTAFRGGRYEKGIVA